MQVTEGTTLDTDRPAPDGRGQVLIPMPPGIVESTTMTSRLWTEEQRKANRASRPARRLSTPGDIAEAAAWLSSDRAQHINGQILNIDGGFNTR